MDWSMTATVEQLKLWSLLASSCGTAPMTPFLEKFANNARTDLVMELAAKQAEIDALMLEFCPERMSPEQIGEWEVNQKSVDVDVDLLAQSCETKRVLRIAKEALEMQVAEEKQTSNSYEAKRQAIREIEILLGE